MESNDPPPSPPSPPLPKSPSPPESSSPPLPPSGGLCVVGSGLRRGDWTCSQDVWMEPDKRKRSEIRTAISQTLPGIKLDLTSVICQKCSQLFGKRRSKSCNHPKHQQQFAKHAEVGTKALSFITAEDYFSKYQKLGLQPNHAVCRNTVYCYGDEDTDEDADVLSEEPLPKRMMLQKLNTIRQELSPGSTPLSLGKRNLAGQARAVKIGLEEINKTIAEEFESSGMILSQNEDNTEQLKKDSEDLLWIMGQLKTRIQGCSQAEKKALLTLVPPSWTIEKTQNFFNVGRRLVIGSRKRFKQGQMILPPIKPKSGKKIKEETTNMVLDFYNQDDVSRATPGQKECLSIKNNITGKREKKQKRYLLCNLKELYQIFKNQHPEEKIGKSTFMMLRPQECLSLTSKGYHNVCLCVYHENVKLLYHAVKIPSIKPIISQLVCPNPTKLCYYRRCSLCKEFLTNLRATLGQNEVIKKNSAISYRRWLNTDGTQYVVEEKEVQEFLEFAALEAEKLLKHHYISRAQQEYLTNLKPNLNNNEIIIWGDFAENYSPVIQNAVQSEYFSHKQITIHPFTIYWTINGITYNIGISIISDCTAHDTNSFYAFQSVLLPKIKTLFAEGGVKMDIQHIHYFSDGCAAQYKNRKNFWNLYYHQQDFNVSAEWHFFATAHGKGPCDAQGGTTKRLAKAAALQGKKITTAEELFAWSIANVKGFEYILVTDSEVQRIIEEKEITARNDSTTTIPGTQQAHRIKIQDGKILLFETSNDTVIIATKVMEIEDLFPAVMFEDCTVNDWIGCLYEGSWYIALIQELDQDLQELKVGFYKSNSRGKLGTSFVTESSSCFIPIGHVLKKLSPPKTSRRGRTIIVPLEQQEELDALLKKFKNQ